MVKPTFVTLATARKDLEAARVSLDNPSRIRGRGSLGQKVYQLAAGIHTRKERAATRARLLVELMEARGLAAVERVTLRDRNGEEGFSTVYLLGAEVLFVWHSQIDRHALGDDRQRQLDRLLAERV